MLTETLPRTTIANNSVVADYGTVVVSTIAMSPDFVWETCVFFGDGENTDPVRYPQHRRNTMLNGFNAQIASIGHQIVCERIEAGVNPWAAVNVSKEDIKAVINSR